MNIRCAVFAVLLASAWLYPTGVSLVSAGELASDYAGIYVMSARPVVQGPAVPPEVYHIKAIDGVYLRQPWSAIEKAPGLFDWASMDGAISLAINARKKISLAILAGRFSPDWLDKAGARRSAFSIPAGWPTQRCVTMQIPWPWDRGYQDAYIAMTVALSHHLRSWRAAYSALKIVKISPIAISSEELRMPVTWPARLTAIANPCPQTDVTKVWQRAGFRPSLVLSAWTRMADAVAQGFPGKLLAIDILDGNDFPPIGENGSVSPGSTTRQAIISASIARFPGRFAVQWDGLTASNFSPSTEAARRSGAVIGWSTNEFRGENGAGCNATRREFIERHEAAAPCNAAGYDAILQHAVNLHGRFIEVWSSDALRFPQAMITAHRALAGFMPNQSTAN
ncbi:MAG TPA: hypothetical protein VNX86_11565 [Rhizomicrobium sp.]|jgi:hypothetical protein|nr:hypothetical protein [Rhizomicrobium sp.]